MIQPSFLSEMRRWLWIALFSIALSCQGVELVPSIATNGFFRVQFQSVNNTFYVLLRGTNPTNINDYAGEIFGNGENKELTDPSPFGEPATFYRLREIDINLVINEVDYDQPGTDNACFVEVYNNSSVGFLLTNFAIVLVNGNGNGEYARYNLASGAATTLHPGGYLVIANPQVVPPVGTITITAATDFLQNGPDAIALFNLSSHTVVDALSYGGSITNAQINGESGTFNLVEGNATPVTDNGTAPRSLIRSPNGTDTDNAFADWAATANPSPGSANP